MMPDRADRPYASRQILALLPWLVMGIALWLSYTAFRVAVGDLIYPQQPVLRPSHWVYQMSPDKQQRRIERALSWTPTNGWYWQILGQLMATSAQQAEQAAAFYHRALQQTPTDPGLQLGFRAAMQRLPPDSNRTNRRHTDAARPTPYAHIARLAPTHPHIHYRIGVSLLAEAAHSADLAPWRQRSSKALPFFRRAMQLDPAYYAKTLHAYQTHFSTAEALTRFAEAIPPTPQGHLIAARQFETLSWIQARRHYLAALAINRSNPGLMRDYGQALMRHQAFDAAITMWEQLRQAAPDDTTAYLGLADAYRALGDQEGERQALQQLVSHVPQQAEYLDRLAHTHMRHGLISEATAVWQTLMETHPESPIGYLGLAHLHEAQQNYPAAIAMLQQVVSLAPGTITHHHRLAQLYVKSGDTAKALREYKRLAALRPDHPWVFYHLGEHFRQAGEYQRAITYYRQAQSLTTGQALYWRQMGLAYAARHEHRQAIHAYRQALQLDGSDADTHYYLGISYEADGTPELARLAYTQAVQLAPEHAGFQQAHQRMCCPTLSHRDASR
jgi:tetratricopeptide (TPR) repeat protein